jgi:hypothetical protein
MQQVSVSHNQQIIRGSLRRAINTLCSPRGFKILEDKIQMETSHHQKYQSRLLWACLQLIQHCQPKTTLPTPFRRPSCKQSSLQLDGRQTSMLPMLPSHDAHALQKPQIISTYVQLLMNIDNYSTIHFAMTSTKLVSIQQSYDFFSKESNHF